jgi:hypothetical protein
VTASDAVISASYGGGDEMCAGHCQGWWSLGDRRRLPELSGCVEKAMRVVDLRA